MRYHSVSSGGVKDYVVHPYRLAFAQGGIYLLGYVPAYGDVRTFAVDRIQRVSLEKQTFAPKRPIGEDVFANSLGVNTGPAARVEIEFAPAVAPYIRARIWHTSQQLREGADGTLVLAMDVCHDWALRSWILSWGRFARVLTPAALADELRSDLQATSERYEVGSHSTRTVPH
jgi:proteasome accessory factor B